MEAMYQAESILAAAFKMLEKDTSLGFDRKAFLLGRMMRRVTLLLTKKQGKGREAHEWADLADINEALMAECLGKHTAASGSKSEPEGGPYWLGEGGGFCGEGDCALRRRPRFLQRKSRWNRMTFPS